MDGVSFEHVASSKAAIKKLKEDRVDLLVVDLQIPSEPGQEIDVLGGKVLLDFVYLNGDIPKPTKVVAFTVHEDSFSQCSEYFAKRGWSLLLNATEDQMAELLQAQLMYRLDELPSFDIAIVTALEHTELQAVLQLPYSWTATRFKDDITSYSVGTVTLSNGQKKSVIACSAPRMGIAASASLATKICLKFRPQFLAMTGVAAAVKGEAEIGDILIADPSWDWGSGKLTVRENKVVLLSEPTQIPLEPALAARVRSLAASREHLDQIYTNWKGGKRPAHDLNVRIGPVASGAVVLEDPDTVELIKRQNRKTIGIEMEAFGVMSAAFYSGAKGPQTIVIKSVCDFADPSKNNEWQAYAAYTSSAYLDQLLRNHVFVN